MDKTSKHTSVLLEEAVDALEPGDGKTYLDATFGAGGHSRRLLSLSSPTGKVIGLDRDRAVQPLADQLIDEFPARFEFYPVSYTELGSFGYQFDGILFDLGLSSDQLEQSGRGFSFSREEPLDMRFDDTHGQTAAQFLMQSPINRIEKIFYEYAQDRYAKQLARKIVESRRDHPIRTTTDFVRLIGTEQPKVLAPLFQALRIEVNDELHTLQLGLTAALTALKPGGRLSVISFHSLEDRIVKDFMRSQMMVVTKKPILPSASELASNPRARSAKLRVAQKN